MLDDFAVFILSHGRPDKVITYHTLQKAGYTGRVYIVIDNEDKTADDYYKNYGNKVIMFDKKAIAETFDEGDNFEDRRAVIYARNACFEIAKNLEIKYFLELDDDYVHFAYQIDDKYEGSFNRIKTNIDLIFIYYLDFYKSISAKSIAMSQGGDWQGGLQNDIDLSINRRRKCMNSFFCSTDRMFRFVGRINEDVNTYTYYQSLGNLFLTHPLCRIQQLETQHNTGGMTDLYLDTGTYLKSFYSVIYQPSSVCVGNRFNRLHHIVNWDNTVPCIIREEHKKK